MSENATNPADVVVLTVCPVCLDGPVVRADATTWRECRGCEASWDSTARVSRRPGVGGLAS